MWCPSNFEAVSEHKDSKFGTCLGSWACSFEMTLIGEHHGMVGNAIRCRRLKKPIEILYFGPAQSRGPQELVAQRSEKMGGSVPFVTDFLSCMPCMLVLQRSVFPDHVGSKLDVGHASTHSKHSNQYQYGDISLPFV